jgi:chromosome segregation ATPase
METHTPSRRTPKAARTLAPPAFSPTRISRLEEKAELQDLNKRLELYIMKNREKDASKGVMERELDELRDNFRNELMRERDEYARQIAAVREARDSEATQRAELDRKCKDLESQLRLQEEETATARDDQAKARSELDEALAELASKTSEAQRLRDEANALRSQLNVEKARNAELAKELAAARDRASTAESEVDGLRSRAEAAESDLQTFQGNQDAQLQHYRDRVAELAAKLASKEEELRREFADDLQQQIEERQQAAEEEKNEALALLKAAYDEKIAAYRDHLERAGHELERLRNQRDEVEAAQTKIRLREEQFEAVQITLKNRVKELEDEIEAERARPNKLLAEKNEIIRRLKASFKRKDEEFDELMDVKIALALEIKQYRQLIEDEEERLGYRSNKKRKRGPGADAASAEHERRAAEEEESLIISGMDTEGKYINFRNNSTRNISLNGWTLQSQEHKFAFPEGIELGPGEGVTVHTGPGAAGEENFPKDIAWVTEETVWDPAGDEAVLMDPEGNQVARVEIMPTKPIVDALGDGAAAEGGKQEKCAVM